MKKQKNNIFEKLQLDEEELLLEESLQEGNFEDSDEIENTRIMLRDAASRYQYLNTSKPVTLRINQLDLIKIKARAKKSQIPYQTLLNTLIHNFAEGKKELQM